ncbi:MAG TPA: transcription-repair coupling factor [Acidimicrobiales bacterium]|nr:transcription-repair coupling factor [Acidimicrobiales bacterium]
MPDEAGRLAPLAEALRTDPGVRAATPGAVVAVAVAGQAPVLASLASLRADATTLVVAPTTLDAERLERDLVCFLGGSTPGAVGAADGAVVALPAWDTLPFERVSPEVAAMGARHATRWRLSQEAGRPRIVVASARALMQRPTRQVPPPPIVVRTGDVVERDELLAGLVALGYRREHRVEHRGEVAVRGSIVDVWGSTADNPVRVDLFGDEVDRLCTFDPGDQRQVQACDSVWLFTCRELVLDADDRRLAERLAVTEGWGSGYFTRLAAGELFDGMEGWLTWLDDGPPITASLRDGDLVVVLEPSRTYDRASELVDEESELLKVLAVTWGAPVAPPPLHVALDDALAASPADPIRLPAVPEDPGTPVADLHAPAPLRGDPARLASALASAPKGTTAIVCAQSAASASHLAGQLAAEGVTALITDAVVPGALNVMVIGLSAGCAAPGAGFAVWADVDVTGRRAVHRAPRPRSRAVDGFFDDLAPGSFVVHRHHGVARFAGVTTRQLAGTTRDYLILQFRGTDRIYLPTDQIDAITAYSGGETPTLSKMGGADWQRTTSRARAAAGEIAQELVALYRTRAQTSGHAFAPDTPWQREVEALFAFTETVDQQRAIDDVRADMESVRPMDRLVCADVGFGKTEVAVRAVFKCVQDSKQAAVLVPTTLLASQHFQTFSDRYAGYPVRVEMLSRFLADADARRVIAGVADGSVDVVIGTHRLLAEGIEFKDLGLLVVDEEQRFGVTHKESMKRLATDVDVLTLTASPIPRTLEMALTGIRDMSMIQTPPVDRQPILTYVGEFDDRAVTEALRRELLREGQAFFVHNRVADIEQVARHVADLVPEARVVVAHGQMDEGTLERVVYDFWERRSDVLVCTTIIESGIDMPTVNTLVVDRADLLGLGQLHQLRGRVGRGGQRAYAYLFHPPGRVLSEQAYERLRTIGEHTELGSGFKIAMRDLEIRGAGNLLGRDQSGHVAAVGYDLYVQLVAEAIGEATGVVRPELPTVSLDVPGDAHLPTTYVTAEDDRLDAYRRLARVTTLGELADVDAEWQDRFGPLPEPARILLALAELRVECLRCGVREIQVLPARGGIRRDAVARLSPLELALSAQVRLRRLHGEDAYEAGSRTVRVVLDRSDPSPRQLTELLRTLVPVA